MFFWGKAGLEKRAAAVRSPNAIIFFIVRKIIHLSILLFCVHCNVPKVASPLIEFRRCPCTTIILITKLRNRQNPHPAPSAHLFFSIFRYLCLQVCGEVIGCQKMRKMHPLVAKDNHYTGDWTRCDSQPKHKTSFSSVSSARIHFSFDFSWR